MKSLLSLEKLLTAILHLRIMLQRLCWIKQAMKLLLYMRKTRLSIKLRSAKKQTQRLQSLLHVLQLQAKTASRPMELM